MKEAIQVCMQESGDTDHEDVVRAFFRFHVNDLWKLPKIVTDLIRTQSQSGDDNSTHSLAEANRITIVRGTRLNCP